MSTLAEIESAVDLLPAEQKEKLLHFLAMRLRKERALPEPHDSPDETLTAMTAEDQPATGKASEWLQTAKGSVHATAGESADMREDIESRAKRGKAGDLAHLLSKAPNRDPLPGDEL